MVSNIDLGLSPEEEAEYWLGYDDAQIHQDQKYQTEVYLAGFIDGKADLWKYSSWADERY